LLILENPLALSLDPSYGKDLSNDLRGVMGCGCCVIKKNEVFGVMGMFNDNRFSKVIMKSIDNIFFESSLDISTSLVDI
jgi:hypothetical protein